MITVFKYKKKIVPHLFILFITLFIPLLLFMPKVYQNPIYYIILISVQVIYYLYQSSKSLLITENGIEQKILWSISWENIRWEEIEEAEVIIRDRKSIQPTLQAMKNPVASFTQSLEGIIIGTTIKFIITNRDAVYLKLQNIQNSSKLNDILIERVRFVK